jgi:hypothetical protein
MLIGISSPYQRRGILHDRHQRYFGQPSDDVLVIQAESRALNPTLDEGIIARALEADAEAARSEWQAEFRSDLSALFDDAVIDDAVEHARPLELPPRRDQTYFAFADMSGGRHDAATLCIGHVEKDAFICDVIRGRLAPFDPADAAREYAALAREYGCKMVTGDAYAGEWTKQAFEEAGIAYELSDLPKSGLYLESLPWFNRGAIRIPPHSRLQRELRTLERRVHRSGKDSVDHPRNGSDDFANALAGCLHLAVAAGRRGVMRVGTIEGYCAGPVRWREPARARGLRVVLTDENGREITPEQAQAIRHGARP